MAFQGQSSLRRPMGLNSPTRPQTVRLTPTATTIALPRSSSTGVSGPRVSSGDDNRGSHSHKLGWMSKSTAVHTDMDYVLLSKLEDSMQSMQRSVFAHLKPLEGSSNQYSHKARLGNGITSPELVENMHDLSFSDKSSSSTLSPMLVDDKGNLTGINGGSLSANGGSMHAHEGAAKPSISFACLIGMAILAAEDRRLTVSEVYDWMKKIHPYFDSPAAGSGWKNSVRHNLSLNKHFVKQTRDHNGETTGKGSYWTIRPESIPAMEAAIRKQESARHAMEQAGSGGSLENKGPGIVPHVTKVTLPRRPTTHRPKASHAQATKYSKSTSLSISASSAINGTNGTSGGTPLTTGTKTSAASALSAPSSKRHRLHRRDSNGMDVDDQHVAAMLCSLTTPNFGSGPSTSSAHVSFPLVREGDGNAAVGKPSEAVFGQNTTPAPPTTAVPPSSLPPQNRHLRRATSALPTSGHVSTGKTRRGTKPVSRHHDRNSAASVTVGAGVIPSPFTGTGIKASFSPNALRGDSAASGGVQRFTYVPSSAKHRRRDLSSATIAAAVARTATTGAVDTEERLFTPSAPPVQRVSSSTGEGDDVMLEDAEPSGHTSTCADSATSTPVAPAMGCVANRSAASEEGSSRCLFKFSAPMSMGGGPGAREPWRYTPESATTGTSSDLPKSSVGGGSGSHTGMTPPKTRRKLAIHTPEGSTSDEAAAAALLDLSGLFGAPIVPLKAN